MLSPFWEKSPRRLRKPPGSRRLRSNIVACRFNNTVKILLASQALWTEVDDGLQIAESTYQAQGWEKPRRIIMVRQETDKRPRAAGKKITKIRRQPEQLELFPDVAELGKFRYSCFITSLSLPARAVYDLYRGRADSENRIKEIKYDFSADKFVSQNFWATEACDAFIIMAYNFISLFRHAIINSGQNHFLKTIRYKILSIPAYIEKKGDKRILRLVRTMNQRQAFLGLWRTADEFEITQTKWV